MYVIKRQQLFPEGDPIPFRDRSGALLVFQEKTDADKAAVDLLSDPHNRGWRFLVETIPPPDDDSLAAMERRAFQV